MPGKRRIRIYPEKCKGCMLCLDVCPKGLLRLTEKVNAKGFRYIEISVPENCKGCGMCYLMCPDNGIEIVETDEQ